MHVTHYIYSSSNVVTFHPTKVISRYNKGVLSTSVPLQFSNQVPIFVIIAAFRIGIWIRRWNNKRKKEQGKDKKKKEGEKDEKGELWSQKLSGDGFVFWVNCELWSAARENRKKESAKGKEQFWMSGNECECVTEVREEEGRRACERGGKREGERGMPYVAFLLVRYRCIWTTWWTVEFKTIAYGEALG